MPEELYTETEPEVSSRRMVVPFAVSANAENAPTVQSIASTMSREISLFTLSPPKLYFLQKG